MSAAVYLAHEIEWTHAIERCRLKGKFKRCGGPNAKQRRREIITAEFDPHAATELADLIEHRMLPALHAKLSDLNPPPAREAIKRAILTACDDARIGASNDQLDCMANFAVAAVLKLTGASHD